MKNAMGMFAALIIALAMTGVAYAHWSESLLIVGIVETGIVDASFEDAESDDDCIEDDGLDPPTNDKDVAYTGVEIHDDGKVLVVYIANAYPSYSPTITSLIKNTGTIPIKLENVKLVYIYCEYNETEAETVVDVDLESCTAYYIDFETGTVDTSEDLGDDLMIHMTYEQFDAEEVAGSLEIHVLQGAQEDAFYYFEIRIVATQWNLVGL